ncbi:response regulator transcription factor [Salmonella enterica]|nr:response regulator [Salmonella enterica]
MVPLSIVIRGRILVIDGDEWLGRLLSRVLQEKGFATDFCEDAQSGFQKACDTVPDGIVCSVVLPDIDGFWVARRIRTEIGAVAKTPLVLLGDLADKEARIQGLHVGAVVK